MWRSIWLSCALTLSITSACFPPDDGVDPPLDRIYFPVGLGLSSGGDRLYVANSDFDLQYNAGTLQALDAAAIRRLLPVSCKSDSDCLRGSCDIRRGSTEGQGFCEFSGSLCPGGVSAEQSSKDSFLAPAPCRVTDLSEVLLDSARISPFVSDLTYTLFTDSKGKERARLFLPVRADATLHWADAAHDLAGTGPVLECGQDKSALKRCDDEHRRGDGTDERSAEGEFLPTEPFALAVSTDGRTLAVAHQTQGAVSLLENTDQGPELLSVLRGLPFNPMAVIAVPPPQLAQLSDVDYQPGFWVTFRGGGRPAIELLRYIDKKEAPHTPFLQRAGVAPITVSSGFDTRGIAIDASDRVACESACDVKTSLSQVSAAARACLETCASVQLDVVVASRSPESLMFGKTGPANTPTRSDDLPNFSDMLPMRGGPSKVWVGNIIDEQGEPSRRIFAVAFDANWLYIYDPARSEVEVRLTTGRGPQGVAIDERNGLAYVAHFTDSYVGVVDLDKRHATYGKVLLNVGQPKPPRAEQ
ncbi:MAG: hypothetical protein RJA70_422 [Pseudomonadota bacterium]|jgi:hypothetical protein